MSECLGGLRRWFSVYRCVKDQWESSGAECVLCYLFVRMVVGVNVIVELLMFVVLFITQLTVEISLQVLQSFSQGFLLFRIILKRTHTQTEFIKLHNTTCTHPAVHIISNQVIYSLQWFSYDTMHIYTVV